MRAPVTQAAFEWDARADEGRPSRESADVRSPSRSYVPGPTLHGRQLGTETTLPPDSELWDVRAAAKFLKRSVSWVYHKAEDGTLPVRRLDGWGVRFVPAELRAWVVEHTAPRGARR
jgi:predicted DNA-binding transcriptional regulator AlpA